MPILNIILLLVLIGLVLWLINRYVPMQATIKTILNVFVVIVVIYLLLKWLGVFDTISRVKV